VRRYDTLFILNTSAEDSQTCLDTLRKVLTEAGAKVEAMEPADRRAFARVADKRHTAGFYANITFELDSAQLPALEVALKERPEVFRYQVIQAAAPAPADA